MHLTGHDLKQITDSTLDKLTPEQLLPLSKLMLADLVETRDRLNQNSNNSSKPPSTEPPWAANPADQENAGNKDGDDEDHAFNKPASEDDNMVSPENESPGATPETSDLSDKTSHQGAE